MGAMIDHLYGNANVYEVEYRIKTKYGNYKWYYDRGRITQYDTDGKPLFLAGIVFDITEKKEMQIDLEIKNRILVEQSSTDGLTKVKNHRALIEHLKSETEYSLKTKSPLSIAIFDIDNFKNINDSKGHVYGDKVLIDVARIMEINTRETDLVGRYGGEEFMIVFSEIGLKDAQSIAEHIRQAIEQHCFSDCIRITISGGVYEYTGGSLIDLIKAADINLYEAKKQGKNRIIYR